MAGTGTASGFVQAVRSKLHGRKAMQRRNRPRRCGPLFEVLEPRLLLSASATFATSALADYGAKPPAVTMPLTAGTQQSSTGASLFVTSFGGVGQYTTSGATVNASLIPSDFAAVAVSGSDLFVVDTSAGTIGEYTTSGATVNASLITGLSDPRGIAISGPDLFVTDFEAGTIGEYTTSGATVNASLVTGLNLPYGIAISGLDMFVTNQGPGLTYATSGTIGEYTTYGVTVNASLITGLSAPYGIAISGSDLFVASGRFAVNGVTIGEYTTSGATVNASLITGLNDDFGSPRIAISGSDLFVTSEQFAYNYYGVIAEYTTSGTVVNASLITGLTNPEGIAISGSDLFVTDFLNYPGTIGEYTTSGATVNASLITGLNGPTGIAISGSDMFVANSYSNTIGEYTTSGATVNASLITGLSDPYGIAISGSDMFVTNEGSGTIGEYTTSGATVNASLITGLGGTDDMNGPTGIAISGSDLFVAINSLASYGSGMIGEYTTSGATVNASLITGLNGLNAPTGIAISGSDLFVAIQGSGSIFSGAIGEYTTSGATVNASLITDLSDPNGIAISGSDMFVANEGYQAFGGAVDEYTTSGSAMHVNLIMDLTGPVGIAIGGPAAPTITSVITPASPQTGSVAVSYTLADANSDACSIVPEYSLDGGVTWNLATPASGGDGTSNLSSSLGGTVHTFIWNSAVDIAGLSNSDVEFRITPSDAGNDGGAATTGVFTVDNTTPQLAAPTGILATPGALDDVVVSWNAVTGATSYQVWRGSTGNAAAAKELASGVTSTAYDDSSTVAGSTYYYWVSAANGAQTGALSSPISVQLSGAGTGGQGLGPLDMMGTFTLDRMASGFTANGSDIQIGFQPPSGQTFQALLTVDGHVSYDSSEIVVNGTVSAAIGGLGLPLFTGNFDISNSGTSAGEVDSLPGTLRDTSPATSELIAGCPINITSLALLSTASGPEIRVSGNIALPSPLDTTISGDVLITSQGMQLANGPVSLPDIGFTLAGLSIQATAMSVSYISSGPGELLVQGTVALNDMLAGVNVDADLSGQTNGTPNGITVEGGTVNLAGTLSLSGFDLMDGWGLQNASLTFNTSTLTYSGTAELAIPGVFNVGVTFSLVSGQLDSLGLSLSGLGASVPLGDTGWFLSGGRGSVENLVSGGSPITFTGSLDFTFGPDEAVTLPGWLGGAQTHTDLADLQLTASINSQVLTGFGNLELVGNVASASVNATFDIATGSFSASGDTTVLGGVFSGPCQIVANQGEIAVEGSGAVSLPLHDLSSFLPNVGPIAGGGLLMDLHTSAPSASKIEAWGNAFGHVLGVGGSFSGAFWLVNAQPVLPVDPPASATFAVASGTDWAMFESQWTDSVGSVPYELESPDGTVYDASNLPSNVSVVTDASGPTELTLSIANPTAGNWTMIMTDTSTLGTVSFNALDASVPASVQLAYVTAPGATMAGSTMNPMAVVAVEDQTGSIIATDDSEVTLTLAGGLGSTPTVLTAQAVNGIATFSGVAPDQAGSYTLTATDGSDGSAVANFDVVPAPTASVTFLQSPTNVIAGVPIAPAVTVQAVDAYGNAIAGDLITLNILDSGSMTPDLTLTASTDGTGVATFSDLFSSRRRNLYRGSQRQPGVHRRFRKLYRRARGCGQLGVHTGAGQHAGRGCDGPKRCSYGRGPVWQRRHG